MERRVSMADARTHFDEIMEWVIEQESPVIVEGYGRPLVIMLSAKELRLSADEQEDWRTLVRRARARVRAELGDRGLPPPEMMLHQVRAG